MKKKLTAITLATTLIMGSSIFGNHSFAETTEELDSIQNQRSEIKENLSEAEKKVSGIVSDIESLNQEIERVNQLLVEKETIIEQTENNIDTTIQEINELQGEIKELEENIEKRFDILRNRASSYQESGGTVNYLEVIFGSASFGDFISRVSTVNKIAESDASLMEQLELDIQKVEENQRKSMEKLDELNTMKAEQEEAMLVVKEQKEKNEQNKQALVVKQEDLTSMLNDLKNKDSSLASLEEEVKQSIVAAKKEAAEKEREEKKKSVGTDKQNNASNIKKVVTKTKNITQEQKKKDESQNKAEEKKQTKKDKENSKTFSVTATAYTLDSAGGSGRTYTGINLRKNPNKKVIAVDPNVIPLNSVVHVEGYGYAIAGDIGSAIKGKKIDVYVPTNKEAINWGVRTVKVTVQ